MRLVCPNCGAQYEVDDRVIPDSGRDVQCSSCGHAWYQMPAHMEAAAEAAPSEPEEGPDVDADDETLGEYEAEAEPEPGDEAEPPAEDVTEAAAETETGAPEPAAPEPPAEQPAPGAKPEAEAAAPAAEDEADAQLADVAAPPRRELDQSLRAILQEEAERERAARAADREPPAGAPEPGTVAEPETEAATPAPDLAAPPAAAFDDDEIPDIGPAPERDRPGDIFAAAPEKAPRRDLFPDIEEINSTLDSHGPDVETETEEPAEGRGGFGRSFFAIIFLAALALAIYLVAPRLAETIPALEPALTGYVGALNGARDWLEGLLQGLTTQMNAPE